MGKVPQLGWVSEDGGKGEGIQICQGLPKEFTGSTKLSSSTPQQSGHEQ